MALCEDPAGRPEFALYFRAGAIIPMNVRNSVTGRGDEKSAGATTLLVFPAGESELTCYPPVGEGVEYAKVGLAMDEAHTIKGLVG